MNSDEATGDNIQKDTLNEVINVFKSIITQLLRTSGRTVRRVIFSKNNEEFDDLIKENLKKKLINHKYRLFLKDYKSSLENLSEKNPSVMDKIMKTLSCMNEDKLKMIFQVITIITGMNNVPDKNDKKNLNLNQNLNQNLISNLNQNFLLSNLNKEQELSPEKMSSIYSFQDPNDLKLQLQKDSEEENNNSNFDDQDKLSNFLDRKRTKLFSPPQNKIKRKINLNLNKVVTKTYEMSDKTSLFSNEDMIKEMESQPLINPPKTKFNKINILTQNKNNYNMIHNISNLNNLNNLPNLTPQSNMTFMPNNLNNNSSNNYSSNNNNNIHIQKIKNYNSFLPTSNQSIFPMGGGNCPKIMIDFDHSSNSDIDPLLVTSEIGRKKMIKKSNSNFNENLMNKFNNNYVNNNLNINSEINSNNPSIIHSNKNSKSHTPDAPHSLSKKPKQIFFPCEINPEDIYNLKSDKNMNQNEEFYTEKDSNNSFFSKKQMNPNNFMTQNPMTQSSNYFNSNFTPMNPYSNTANNYAYFSQTNTPKTSNSNNPYISDLIFNQNYSGFKQPISQRNETDHNQNNNLVAFNFNNFNNNVSNNNGNSQNFNLKQIKRK